MLPDPSWPIKVRKSALDLLIIEKEIFFVLAFKLVDHRCSTTGGLCDHHPSRTFMKRKLSQIYMEPKEGKTDHLVLNPTIHELAVILNLSVRRSNKLPLTSSWFEFYFFLFAPKKVLIKTEINHIQYFLYQ